MSDIFSRYSDEDLKVQFADRDAEIQRLNERIAELEAQIDKLKACGNCTHYEPHCITNEMKCAIDNQYRNRDYKCNQWEAK